MNKIYKISFGLSLFGCMLGYIAKAQPAFEWAVKWGGAGYDQGLAMTVTSDGHSFVTGSYAVSANFGSLSVNSVGSNDAAVAKLDPTGSFLWVKNLGGSQNESGTAVAVDPRGNVYVAGGFSSPDFSPDGTAQSFSALGWNNIFVVKYDATGAFKWVKTLGGTQGDYCEGVAVDKDGNVYLSGMYSSDDFAIDASNNLPAPVGGADLFLIKLDSNGNHVWSHGIGGKADDYGQGLTLDEYGNLFVTGFINDSVNFDPNGYAPLPVYGVSDAFVAKYDTAGNFQWARRIGGASDEYGFEVATDKTGAVVVVGIFNGVISIDGYAGTLPSAGARDAFVVKYDSAGNYVWSKGIGDSDWDEAFGVAIDGGNNVYVTGVFAGDVDFGSGTALTAGGFGDGFIVKYDPSGNYIWAKQLGGSAYDRGKTTKLDGSGNLFVGGHFMSDPAEFNLGGTGGQLSAESADGFLVKYICSDTSSGQVSFEICGSSFTFHGVEYTSTGVFTQTIPNVSGCDSFVTIDLTLNPIVQPVITVNEFVLGVTQSYASYQWMDESGDIPGATNATYTVTSNGKYSVRATDANGCESTSDIYEVTNVSVHSVDGWSHVYIYPNPAKDVLHVASPVPVIVSVRSIDGRLLFETTAAGTIDMTGITPGIYLLSISDMNGQLIRTEKVTKQ